MSRVAEVSEALTAAGLRLALAESCTGGLVAARLTDRPGASRFLEAGLVTYSNAAKQSLLGVRSETLAAHGAVSEPVVREMLRGARERTGADAAIAITGVAGPEGGTPEKPVGTVWIGAGVGPLERVRGYRFDGDRAGIRAASADAALELLHELLAERS
ncbi:MAG: CinA family protein [Longimicrobiales bacterium]|nr:CinA family protein [Longimicrobiales bacterium]